MLTILRMLASKAAWLALSFALVVLLLAFWHDLPAKVRNWRSQADNAAQAPAVIADGAEPFRAYAAQAVAGADKNLSRIGRLGSGDLAKAERDIVKDRDAAGKRVLTPAQIAQRALTGDFGAIADGYRAQYVDLPLIERAADAIALAQAERHRGEVDRYNAALRRLNGLKQHVMSQRRRPLCRRLEVPGICRLSIEARKEDERLQRERQRLERVRAVLRAKNRAGMTLADGQAMLTAATGRYAGEVGRLTKDADGFVLNRSKSALRTYGWQAFRLVLAAALLPILHKLFAFHLIAPLAATARPVRLADRGPPLGAGPAAISARLALDQNDELLLRSGLQSTSADVRGDDKLLLDCRMPFTCLAAGLVNLQRLRSDRANFVTVTAIDAHHRVATIEVPEAGAVTLHPRALLGVLKRRNRDLVITRPWRLGQLVSWITFQFRYIIFHGPCTLIVQGREGIEVEEASAGRMINKRLTLGFDAAVSYGAARSASFLPYLRGQASLFNDRFEGTGRYFYEPRPALGRGGGVWGRGLKGIGDAAMNALGI